VVAAIERTKKSNESFHLVDLLDECNTIDVAIDEALMSNESSSVVGSLGDQACVKLNVSSLGGPLCTVAVERAGTVFDMCKAIEDASAVPIYEQRLLVGCQELSAASDTLKRVLFDIPVDGVVEVTLVRDLERKHKYAQWYSNLSQNGLNLATAAKDIQEDRLLVLVAVQQNGAAIYFADRCLQNDPQIKTAAR